VLLVVDEREEAVFVAGGTLFFPLGLKGVGVHWHGLLDRKVAARRGERVDTGEQLVLGSRGEIDQ
jgi:hypothetical protein